MIGDLFDSPWKILIVAVVIIVLFGSKKLPDTARSLGRSMRILKTEVQGMQDDEVAAGAAVPTQLQSAGPATADAEAQIVDLRRRLDELQRQAATNGAAVADTQQAR